METETKETEVEKIEESAPEEEPQEAPNLAVEARKAAEELKKENERMEKNLKKQELLIAEQALAGKSVGGGSPKEPEQTPEEFANSFAEKGINPLNP